MALFDKVKEQASQLAQKAQEAGKAGQAKIEDAQARRKADAMLRQLGAAVYAQRTAGASGADVDRLIAELQAFEAANGPIASAEGSSGEGSSDDAGASGAKADDETPEGGFKL